ncbi:hypothetical protein ACHAQA_005345 [Verticillium albo-atrum]
MISRFVGSTKHRIITPRGTNWVVGFEPHPYSPFLSPGFPTQTGQATQQRELPEEQPTIDEIVSMNGEPQDEDRPLQLPPCPGDNSPQNTILTSKDQDIISELQQATAVDAGGKSPAKAEKNMGRDKGKLGEPWEALESHPLETADERLERQKEQCRLQQYLADVLRLHKKEREDERQFLEDERDREKQQYEDQLSRERQHHARHLTQLARFHEKQIADAELKHAEELNKVTSQVTQKLEREQQALHTQHVMGAERTEAERRLAALRKELDSAKRNLRALGVIDAGNIL